MRLYPRLAVNGIRNNARIYYPYIGTCIGIVAIFYLVSSMSTDDIIRSMKGGRTLCELMFFARYIIGLFSIMFLFFTNGFISKRRTSEFGLYNVLGMNKRNIGIVILLENLIVYLISMVSGIIIGIGLTKFAEAGVSKILKSDISYGLNVPVKSVVETIILFAAVFGLIILNSWRHITFTGAAQLVKNENMGDKPPRGNLIMALSSVIMLVVAYYLARQTGGLRSMLYFFIAVLLVILATYILFITGFTAACRLMKKNKRYYYNKKHFVTVSSMNFRMHRGGAGLGTICILTTMVLVVMSSTTCFYGGIDKMIESNYPRDYELDLRPDENTSDRIRQIRQALDEYTDNMMEDGVISNVIKFSFLEDTLYYEDGKYTSIDYSDSGEMEIIMDHLNDLVVLNIVSEEDAEYLLGRDVELADDEALVWFSEGNIKYDMLSDKYRNIALKGITRFREIDIDNPNDFFTDSSTAIASRMILIVKDFPQVASQSPSSAVAVLFFDSDKGPDYDFAEPLRTEDGIIENAHLIFYSKADITEEVYGVYGGLLFMGIMLCIIFLAATVLLMYYRQVVEGYEDRNRFRILRKIGMEKKSIAASINSQILVVFVSPVILAVLHTIMATPFLMFFMKMQGMWFTDVFIKVLFVTFIVFIIVYFIVYKLTSRIYYKIVLG